MPIDPITTLALSIQSSKGTYALLLGSGVSRSAAIPTGWEVVIHLIEKLAVAQNEVASPSAERWFKSKYDHEPNYSSLLDSLTSTSAERKQLLRSYFEPSDEDIQQGLKVPTPGHKAIAELVRLGFIRVIVTTNFDKLIERALQDANVEPIVISTTDAINGAPPLIHSRCTVVKLHGDYMDDRLKNTPQELNSYDEPLQGLLDKILDEFGLIVCGWSAEYDTALRAAIESSRSRRYPFYWATRGKPSDLADRLIAFRQGRSVQIASADEFFTKLKDSVVALDTFQNTDPLSQKVAVARVKKYISSQDTQIDFRDLIHNETERVVEVAFGSTFQTTVRTAEDLNKRLADYEDCCGTLLSMIAAAAYWCGPEHQIVVLKCIGRLIDAPQLQSESPDVPRYPALLALYIAGVSAIAGEKYELFALLLQYPVRLERTSTPSWLVSSLTQYAVLDHDQQKHLPDGTKYTPLSMRLERQLRPFLVDYLPGVLEGERAFDLFEYLVGLMYAYYKQDWLASKTNDNSPSRLRRWSGPIGCFAWRRGRGSQWTSLKSNNEALPDILEPFLNAFFPGDSNQLERSRFLEAMRGFDEFLSQATIYWSVYG